MTRLCSAPVIDMCRPHTAKLLKTTANLGPKLWNSLDSQINLIPSFLHYKKVIRGLVDEEFGLMTCI